MEDEYKETMNQEEGELELEMGYGIKTPEVLQALKKEYVSSIDLSNLPIELLTKDVDKLLETLESAQRNNAHISGEAAVTFVDKALAVLTHQCF